MYSPIQMRRLEVVESHFSANPVYSVDDETEAALSQLHVRGNLVEPDGHSLSDASEDALRVDISTNFSPAEQAESAIPEREQTELFSISLYLGINRIEAEMMPSMPYQIETVTVSDFSAENVPSKEEEEDRAHVLNVVRVNGASMMYGALRRHIQQMTATTAYPTLLLPALNLREIVEKENEVESEQEGSSTEEGGEES